MTGMWLIFVVIFSLVFFVIYFVLESREEKMKLIKNIDVYAPEPLGKKGCAYSG